MDILVLGGGPAGATAAIYAARAGKAVTLVYQDGGALARAEKIENFTDFPLRFTARRCLSGGWSKLRPWV